MSLLFLFYFLGLATEEYFCPPLARMSKMLQLAPDVAGVTLLALGNGAPDVFSSFAGISKSDFGIALGEIIGAGVFITSAIVGSVAVITDCKLNKVPLWRDILFFLVALLFLLVICNDGVIYLWESILLIAYYLLYVTFTVVVSRCQKIEIPPPPPRYNSVNGYESEEETPLIMPSYLHGKSLQELRRVYLSKVGIYDATSEHVHPIQHDHRDKQTIEKEEDKISESREELHMETGLSYWVMLAIYKFKKKSKWAKKKKYQRLIYLITLPFKLALTLTIPSPKEKHWNRYLYILYPLFCPFVVLLAADGYSLKVGFVPVPLITLAASVFLSLIVGVTSTDNHPPRYFRLFILVGFTLSIVWIYLIANEIISLLKILGSIARVSQTILGITVLAWGNCISDLAADIVVARKGLPGMAVAACFAGPLFNMLIGLGISLTIKCAQIYPTPYKAYLDLNLYIGFGFLIVSLISSMIMVPLNGYIVGRKYGIYLLILNFVFSAVSLTVSFTNIQWTFPKMI